MNIATAPQTFAGTLKRAEAVAGSRTRRALALGLLLSLFLHFALTLVPSDPGSAIDATPLTARLTEMPAPPTAGAPPAAPRLARPKRAAPAAAPIEAPLDLPMDATADAPADATASNTDSAAADEATRAIAAAADAASAAAAEAAAAASITPGATASGPTLPPRVDLVYKVFYGTRGFQIGEAVYRFEHAQNRYRISTVGEARGLAALILRGQGKVESRGLITAEGLQPHSFRVERGGPDRVETALFDWESGMLTMHDNSTAPLDLPTFDPLALMWQYYFTPPTDDKVTFAVATPRRLVHYTITREAREDVDWGQGRVVAERWHRRSNDGKTDAYVWLAPGLRNIPVKMRVSNTDRGTVEVLLDSIRADEPRSE